MTVKELALFTGKNERTIRRWISKAEGVRAVPYDKMSQGISFDYTVDEIESILSAGSMSKDAVTILMQNARNNAAPDVPGVDYEIIGKMIGMAVSAAMMPVVKQLESIGRPQLTAPKEDFYSLVAYTSLNGINTNRSELAMHGRALRKMAIEKGLIIKKIPDERYGKVNSYPVEILDEYFEV